MRISIFGLGYVGVVSAGCFSKEGHKVIGVDPIQTKVDIINEGKTPIIEADIGEIISASVSNGSLEATTDIEYAVSNTDISFVCVGTPSQLNGNLDFQYLRKVCEDIGNVLKVKTEHHVVVIRSTILPGTMKGIVIPMLEETSGKKAGVDFGVCNNPEFLREGTAVYDFHNPPKTVIGSSDEESGKKIESLYAKLDAPLIHADIEVAEMVKYVDNIWHALKVGFANEIGNVCKGVGIDSHKVMDIFCQDRKLNISDKYLKPGFAFGGSCLPKDLRAINYKAQELDVNIPILKSILPSNELQVKQAMRLIREKNIKKIGILGFSFKAGTDDLRESPMVDLIEMLIGKGYDLKLYDKNVKLASLFGGNKNYILNHIPHISKLMVENIQDAVDFGELIIIGNNAPEFKAVTEGIDSKAVIDLVRITEKIGKPNYQGICW